MKSARTVLLVTRSDDNESVARVARALEKRGRKPLRLDTDRFPTTLTVTTRIEARPQVGAPPLIGGAAVHRLLGGADVGEVESVWYRRFAAGLGLPEALEDLREPSVDESRRALFGFIAALPCPHVDSLEAVRRCDHKERQLVRASELGLRIPRTIFTNDGGAAAGFIDDVGGDAITKMQSSFAVMRDGVEHVVYTSPVTREQIDDDALRLCPMMFQERIAKSLDVRAVVVGERVFAAAVDAGALVDWRQEGVALMHEWKPHRLPRAVEKALIALVHDFGLRYAACDFVIERDSREPVFLEANAGGEWFWLDDLLGISDAIADELTRRPKKRGA